MSHCKCHMRVFVTSWKKSAVKETDAHVWMSKYEEVGDTLSNDGEAGGQIPTGDQMFPVPFAPCTPSAPQPLFIYLTAGNCQHWSDTSIQQVIFLCLLLTTDSQACTLKQHKGNNTRCYKQNETHHLRQELHIWSTSLCMYIERNWGRRERRVKINKGMEHIKSQCWVVRLTHWFSAATYSIEHWMVDKVNKIEVSVQLPHAANLIKSQGTQTRERLRVWGNHVTVHKMRRGGSETLKQPTFPGSSWTAAEH